MIAELEQLNALAEQIRREVDALLEQRNGAPDSFTTRTYHGPREFRRHLHAGHKRRVLTGFCANRKPMAPEKIAQRAKTCRDRNRAQALPGELVMRDWIVEKARFLGIGRSSVMSRFYAGKFGGLTIRKVNPRLCFVRDTALTANLR